MKLHPAAVVGGVGAVLVVGAVLIEVLTVAGVDMSVVFLPVMLLSGFFGVFLIIAAVLVALLWKRGVQRPGRF